MYEISPLGRGMVCCVAQEWYLFWYLFFLFQVFSWVNGMGYDGMLNKKHHETL